MFYSINKHSERFRLNATEFGGVRKFTNYSQKIIFEKWIY